MPARYKVRNRFRMPIFSIMTRRIYSSELYRFRCSQTAARFRRYHQSYPGKLTPPDDRCRCLQRGVEKYEIADIGLIRSEYNLADCMTKRMIPRQMMEVMETAAVRNQENELNR